MENKYRQFKNPNSPAAFSARLAYELKTKRSLKTGKPLTLTELAWRSGALGMRTYEANWHNTVSQKYGDSSKYNNQSNKKAGFIQHDFSNFDFDSLYDDLDNVRLTKK